MADDNPDIWQIAKYVARIYLKYEEFGKAAAVFERAAGVAGDIHEELKLLGEAAFAYQKANDGDELFDHYRHTLEELGKQKGLLGLIFTKSQNKFQDPAKLRRLIVDLIENGVSVQANVSSANVKARSAGRSYKETWVSMSADVKGDAYEGLLEKNAALNQTAGTKSGAGQYFTPRPLI